MTKKETGVAVNRILRFLYDGCAPQGIDDRKQGRRLYYRISDNFAHYDWRHWQIAIDTRLIMLGGSYTDMFSTYVKISRLYWSPSSGTATRSVDMAEVRCTEERDYENVMAMFAAMKDKSLAPALAGIPEATPIMEEMLK